MRIDIAVVNGTRITRDTVVRILNSAVDLHVSGEFSNLANASIDIPKICPDVIIVEFSDPEFFAKLPLIQMSVSTVVVTTGPRLTDKSILECAKAKVNGYIEGEANDTDWINAVVCAFHGDIANARIAGVLSRLVANLSSMPTKNFSQSLWTPSEKITGSAKRVGLTQRERQIIALVDQGMSNKEIASTLNVELSTVKNHIHSILQKYQVKRRSAAAAYYRKSEEISG